MMKHFDEHMVLNDEQHGFRKGRSCETQLALTVNDLAKILDGRGQADVIIMDFSKAFNLVPHQRLLLKLQQAGVTGPLIHGSVIFSQKDHKKLSSRAFLHHQFK